jgi:hypothetical protein
MLLLALCSCSSGVTGVQNLASPYHLYADAETGAAIDLNSQGGAICSTGAITVLVYRAEDDGQQTTLGDFIHEGAVVPAAAYVFGHGDDGWYLRRLAADEGAKRYPAPFSKCKAQGQPAALMATPTRAPSAVDWRESVQ